MLLRQFFDPKLAQYAYLVGCQQSGEALLIDPLRDIDRYLEAAEAEGLRVTSVAETHIHADFLSGAREFAERLGTRVYLSDEGGDDWASDWARGGEYDSVFLKDGDSFHLGGIEVRAVHTPGHTPEHLSYILVDRGGGASTPIGVATGDFVFVGDLGRPDLLEQAAGMRGVQEPSARQLFGSLPRFMELPDYTQVWPAHGAGSTCGKELGAVPQTTVGYEKLYNASLRAAEGGEDEFVAAILAGQPEPQTYFARMKRDNNRGVPILGELPRPSRLSLAELGQVVDGGDHLVLDTRLDRSAFMARHLPGALHAPLNRSFSMSVGSVIDDETRPIVLVVEESGVEEAVRDLVRIGYDRVTGFVTPATLTRYFDCGGASGHIEEVGFDDVDRLRHDERFAVVDVRFAAEFASGHIPGAINASYTRLPSYVRDRIPEGRTLLVHCAAGGRSAVAASYLAHEGFDVRFVDERLDAWREAGGEVVRAEPADASPADASRETTPVA
jgi:hydroxyacylglutathione hydrolase